MEYNSMLCKHALSMFSKGVEIPDYHLMVGDAEDKTSQNIMIPVKKVPKEIAENMNKYEQMSDSEIMTAIDENMLEVNDLNDNVFLLGINPLGGV